MYSVFTKPVSAVESTAYITAIFKQHALRILHKYLPMYREPDHRGMLAQVRRLPELSHMHYVGDSFVLNHPLVSRSVANFYEQVLSSGCILLNVCFDEIKH